jgi:sulfotransferase
MKQVFFLSGLPRSGSTLLGSILGQNPEISVTPTSPLLDLMCYTNESFQRLNANYTFDYEKTSDAIYESIINGYYNLFPNPIVIDKHRGWPRNLVPVKKFITPNPKIICTIRPISEIITSYIKLINENNQKDNFVDESLRKKNIPISTENRAKVLWEEYISDPYQSTLFGIKNYRENLFFVEYNDLILNPLETINKINNFLNIKKYDNYNFENIINYCAETKDKAWGLENLHNIRKKLEKKSVEPSKILGDYLKNYYDNFNLKY